MTLFYPSFSSHRNTRVPRIASGERLKRLTAHHVPVAWLVGPSTRPTNQGSRLEKHGWMHDDEAPGMAVDLRSLDEHLSLLLHLSIKRVSDEETLKTWLRIMAVDSGISKKGLSLLLDIAAKHGFKEDAVVDYHLGILGGRASGNLFAISGWGRSRHLQRGDPPRGAATRDREGALICETDKKERISHAPHFP